MCGICGAWVRAQNVNLKERVSLMNEAQFRRGPDDHGIFLDKKNGLSFGHRRLSIIDLSKAGRGPMSYSGGVFEITFNGEIYNFLELKKELSKKGYKFKTETDTEVILGLYKEYGANSFSRLRGMFAFALWDKKTKKLFLVRDRYGIKPLYYFSDKERLVFASTVKAIEKSGLISIDNNPQAMIGFLLFGSVPSPITTLKNIFALPPGHYLEKNTKGEEKLVKYYDPLSFFKNKNEASYESIVAEINSRLEEAVKFHLISDAPLGVFLSGGIDSSAVAAFASLGRKEKITTLSVVFEEAEFSEKRYQDLMLERIKGNHKEIKITKEQFFKSYDKIFEAMDQPSIDGVNTFFISKAAKEAGLKVVLSGLGADEIFCGYSHFKRAKLIRNIQKLPSLFKSPLQLFSVQNSRYAKFNHLFNKDILSFYLSMRGLFSPKETARILNIRLDEVFKFIENYSSIVFSEKDLKSLEFFDPVDLFSFLELKFYLQNQLLKDTDFMSMYHSIEVRVPFLDHQLVEYLSALPPHFKLDKKVNKPLLVNGIKNLVPPEILNRRKMGFTFPFEKWFSELPNTNYKLPIFKKSHWSRFWAHEVFKKWR